MAKILSLQCIVLLGCIRGLGNSLKTILWSADGFAIILAYIAATSKSFTI